MKKETINYSNFLFRTTLVKKSTIIFPIILIITSCALAITFSVAKYLPIEQIIKYKNIFLYFVYVVLLTTFTILFSSIKALNIFKDLDSDGIDLIVSSKPISRKSMIFSKTVALIYLNLCWTLVASLCSLIVFAAFEEGLKILIQVGISAITVFLSSMFFSLMTSLLAYKLNSKVALVTPLVLFMPLAIGGAIISMNSTPLNNNMAYYLNTEYKNNKSGNESNTEKFYLNNRKDEFFIVPNGLDNYEFSDKQKEYINASYELSKKSSKEWQIYSYLSIPYQMIDIFNYDSVDVFKADNELLEQNNLSDYLYYNNQENIVYDYKIDEKPDLFTYKEKYKEQEKYIIPGLIKTNNTLDNNAIDSGLIFIRENADSITVNFPEDDYKFTSYDDLAGKVFWKETKEVLSYKEFNEFCKSFYENFRKSIKESDSKLKVKEQLLEAISKEINNHESKLYNLTNSNITVFDPMALNKRTLKSETQRKVYLTISMLYYLYFNKTDWDLLNSLLADSSDEEYLKLDSISINIGEYVYKIGGFKSYTPKTALNKDNKTILRFDVLKSDNNFLFQISNEIFSVKRTKTIINKNYYLLIWLAFIAVFLAVNSALYNRKDYN